MVLLAHESDEAAAASAEVLRGLGSYARKLLEQCVEAQQLERRSVSATAQSLNDAGFVFVRDLSSGFEERFVLSPSLAGEEALEMLEKLEDSAPKKRRSKSN